MLSRGGFAAIIACAALLGGCGGGNAAPHAAPAAAAGTAVAPQTGTPLASATLRIVFPAGFHTARKATAKTRATAAAQRKPAYVNSNPNALDIFVDGVDQTAGLQTTSTTDGTQSVTLNIYSTAAHRIVAVETETGLTSTVLAIGESDVPAGSFVPGDVVAIGLTMAMNAATIGVTSDPSMGSDAVIDTSTGNPYADQTCANIPGTGNTLYLFAADAEGGFVTKDGAGAPIPQLSGITNVPGNEPPGDSLVLMQGLQGGAFAINYVQAYSEVAVSALLANPATAYYTDAIDDQGVYPGVDALYYSNGNVGPLYNALNSIYYSGAALMIPVYIAYSCEE